MSIQEDDINHFSTYLLAQEAEKRGIKVTKIFPQTKLSYLKLEYGEKIETIIGQRIPQLSFNAHFICKNKEMTRHFLKQAGIKTVTGKIFFRSKIKKALEYIKTTTYPLVIKPVDGTWGRDVFLDVKNETAARKIIERIVISNQSFLIEQQYQGKEYRVLATKDKLLGIINRIPANIIGDGKNSIEKLIEIKNSDSRRGNGHEKSLVKIKIDKEVIHNLKEQNLTLKSIPDKGKQIFLRKNSNLSTGGDSVDVTDEAHPKIKELAPRIISAIPGLPYAGFDFMIQDIKEDPEKVGYAVIEINDSPMLSMHHIPYKGKKRNVAREIIDIAFPETKYI